MTRLGRIIARYRFLRRGDGVKVPLTRRESREIGQRLRDGDDVDDLAKEYGATRRQILRVETSGLHHTHGREEKWLARLGRLG